MGEEQRYLRYILPGLTLPISLAAAIALTSPWALVLVVKWLSGSAAASVAALAGLLLSTGGFGFLFAQLYFGLPHARPNHTLTFNRFIVPSFLEKELEDRWRAASGMSPNKPCGCITDKPCMKEDSRWAASHKQEDAAWNLAHYLWQVYVASPEKKLTGDISLQAARLASLGATLVGLTAAFLLWLVWICIVHIWFADYAPLTSLPKFSSGGAIIALILIFVVPFWLLRRNLVRLKEYHSLAVHQGLVRALQLRSR